MLELAHRDMQCSFFLAHSTEEHTPLPYLGVIILRIHLLGLGIRVSFDGGCEPLFGAKFLHAVTYRFCATPSARCATYLAGVGRGSSSSFS